MAVPLKYMGALKPANSHIDYFLVISDTNIDNLIPEKQLH